MKDRPTPRIHSPDRSQVANPTTIDELIPPDHQARLVWALIEDLDLKPLYQDIKSVEGHAGRPAIDPRILVALWLYATDEHIASAHELAAAAPTATRTSGSAGESLSVTTRCPTFAWSISSGSASKS